ncbi:hypothetical protein VOLCADRAFT_107050 [Volvox carteri f. nagariensis]|uniref:Uncharacterized protein n=1 Tax=Volvox carteri f. nagariensis TaxID=3068 RepID=D8UBP4_VOLCA|nr:uncharacterized protein VOLCADRAFT_107050 [Volvox carteri f. nagariensis]EFJ42859.1 hypothetical protein VOLCADRAFT_107050 [Volvox carteri f. nagariensis]|eukprot:XP_002956119.1 hypothetical protein VOLCADRAFT_107050 [Volvox carteri f. nagariensis]
MTAAAPEKGSPIQCLYFAICTPGCFPSDGYSSGKAVRRVCRSSNALLVPLSSLLRVGVYSTTSQHAPLPPRLLAVFRSKYCTPRRKTVVTLRFPNPPIPGWSGHRLSPAVKLHEQWTPLVFEGGSRNGGSVSPCNTVRGVQPAPVGWPCRPNYLPHE